MGVEPRTRELAWGGSGRSQGRTHGGARSHDNEPARRGREWERGMEGGVLRGAGRRRRAPFGDRLAFLVTYFCFSLLLLVLVLVLVIVVIFLARVENNF